MKKFLERNYKAAKIFLVIFLGVLLVVDIYLVLQDETKPTFSLVILKHRTSLIWLTFVFGGLTAKIFYNRITEEVTKEIKGFLIFVSLVIILGITGFLLSSFTQITIPTFIQLLLLLSGGLVASFFWPQYLTEDQKRRFLPEA